VIEIRDGTGKIVASAETSADSAALLLGRQATIDAGKPEWGADLPGLSPVPAAKARARWSRVLRPREDFRLAPQQKLTAVFRTEAQRAADPQGLHPEVNDGAESIDVTGGGAVQDVILRRKP
jgi:hypothetical protein